ncbi:MAG: hypothetical protein HY325_00310 [Chloroflexi bacterium]|nr:hypothetical protein [Chloroflexota bacterium]
MYKGPNGNLIWDIKDIAEALKISVNEVREYFTDGRRVSFLIERRIAHEVLKGIVAKSEGAGFDVIAPDGGKWEVRSISRGGIYFCPSYMVGSGRSFDEAGFQSKLTEIEGYIVADIESFPNVPFWIISSDQVLTWWQNHELGTTTHISRKKALRLIGQLKK